MAKTDTVKTDRDVTELERMLDTASAALREREADLEAAGAKIEQLQDALTRADFRDVGDAAQCVRALVELDRALSHASRPNPALLRAAELVGGDLAARLLTHFEGRPALDDRTPAPDAG